MNLKKYTITLSDPTTKEQFGKDSVTFNIVDTYFFNRRTGYITEDKDGVTLLIITKNKGTRFQPRVYYLDVDGNFKKNSNLLPLLNERGSDLADHIEATLELDTGKLKNITWHRIALTILLDKKEAVRISEYTTREKSLSNNLCLISWEGDNKTGSVKVWYGQKIKESEYNLEII